MEEQRKSRLQNDKSQNIMQEQINAMMQENLFGDIPEMILRMDSKTVIIDYHTPSSGILALPPRILIGKSIGQMGLPEELISINLELLKKAFDSGEIQKKEYALDLPGGKQYFETRVVPISQEEVIEIISDITARKMTGMNLMETERDKTAILNSMSDLFLFYDPDLRIRWASKAAAEAFGKTAEELAGAYCCAIWHQRTEPCDDCPVLRARETGMPQTGQKVTSDGRIWHMKAYPVFNDRAEIIGMTELGEDITYQCKYQEELEISKEKAEMVSQFKSDFLSNLSHEIRTPLNVIIGFADLLENAIIEKKQKEYIESIKASSNNIIMLIDDILDISRIEAGKLNLQFKSVSLYEVMKDIRQMFNLKVAQKHLDFITEIDKELPKFLILDEIRIRQILTNLLSNAIKYTDEGYVKVLIELIEKRSVMGSEEVDIRIIVEDSGIGIPESEVAHVFEPFTQVKTSKVKGSRGHGLGLAITKSVVELMDGAIDVDSEVGRGTRFIITIPEVVVHTFTLGYNHKSDANLASLKGKTILLVDDSEINRKLVRENMENAGVKIIEAEDGSIAISLAEKIKPDLILMDILMPRMDGFEATSIIRENPDLRNIPVIALTALAMKEDVERIEQAGFDDYLLKPFHISDLFEKLGRFFTDAVLEHETGVEDLFGPGDKTYAPDSLNIVLEQINEKYLSKWNEIKVNKEFHLINDFAEGISELGRESGIDFIENFGHCLYNYSLDFDVENIDVCLDTFPKLLEKLKHLNDNAS